MTYDETIKGLRCCQTQYERNCKECPYEKYKQGAISATTCSSELRKDLLSIFNNQKAELENKNIELQAMRGAANSYKAEIERLEKEKDNLIKTYKECVDEVLKEFAERLNREIVEAVISNDKAIAEREKKHKVNRYEDNFCAMCDGKVIAMLGLKSFIDNLVKEMVGDVK